MSVTSLAVVAVVLMMAIGKVTPCDPHGMTNGCSIPFGLPYFYKENFRPDCDKHDICYACGKRYGITRSSCDYTFYLNIRSRCSTDSDVKLTQFCRDVALDYYVAVRLGGKSHYEDPSLYWCSQSWVSSCL